MWRWIAILLCMVAGVAQASQPLFNAQFFVQGVNGTGANWRVWGKVTDYSQLGFSALDVETNDHVICSAAHYGDVDIYRITNIVYQGGPNLTCDVVYAETGTPRSGGPQAGYQIIGRVTTNNFMYLPSLTFTFISEYLQNGARNLVLARLNTSVANLTNVFSVGANGLVPGPATTNDGLLDASGTWARDVSVRGHLTVSSNSTFSGAMVYQTNAYQQLTNGSTINPSNQTIVFVQGDTNAVENLGTPQIAAGSPGQMLVLRGGSSVNTVTLTNGGNIFLQEQVAFTLASNAVMQLIYDGLKWQEVYRCAEE